MEGFFDYMFRLYWAALSRFQWLVFEADVPGNVQESITSGFAVTWSANQKNGISAKLSNRSSPTFWTCLSISSGSTVCAMAAQASLIASDS